MVKTDSVPLTRSPAEISTLNSLRSLPELVLHSQRPQSANDRARNAVAVATSSVTALRSLCGTQGRRHSITDASPHAELGTLERWLALSQVAAKLEDDGRSLEREILAHERKRSALESASSTNLPPAEACELGPKLQCLQEVLGTGRFRDYCRELFVLVRNLRLRLDLYGIRMLDFERHLCRERVVAVDRLLWLLNEAERCLPRAEDATRQESTTPIEHEDYALLFQHCSDPASPEALVDTQDLMALLRSLPLERATLVRYVFEQLADSRRGEGHRPPPDHTRAHHFHAAIKLQRGHCSAAETEAAEAWLNVVGVKAVTLQDLLQFHVTVSDANVSEDAEFVRFVQRMWGFDPLAVKDAGRGEAVQRLLESYTARCNLLELVARKRELLAKIPGAQARIRSATELLDAELQHVRTLQAPAGFSRWLQDDESIHARLGGTLALLRGLTLSGQVLTSIPDFVASLRELRVLDLRDNRLATISSMLGTLKTLRALNLSDNLLRDASFAGADEMWSRLEVLTELRLSGNKLTSLPSSLVAIPNLETLDLSRCSLRSIRGEVVKNWKGRSRLVTLDLHANSLTALPDEIHVLVGTLRRLLLHQNQLVCLPAAVAELIRLEELSLSQNQLAGDSLVSYPLPEGHLAISLAQNQLRVLPRLVVVHAEGKGPPKSLNNSVLSVDVRGNRLRSVVDWSPLVLTNCQALHLQNNGLRELPEGFFTALPALRVCELQKNQLRALPAGIAECTRLQILHVNDNNLQSLPKELAELPFLEVLNAAANELAEIPLEWQAFATQCDGGRVLRSLMLRRNPLRNKTLLAIVDGSTDSSLSATNVRLSATSDDAACEGVIKKLLDGLSEASVILRGTVRVSTRKAWIDSDEEDEAPGRNVNKPKWRGVARDVNHYLEQRLRAMQRPGSASLIVDVKSFERLIRTLPFTCSKRELAHLVRRFLVPDEAEAEAPDGRAKRNRQIDGLAFLQAIERFGRWRSISVPSKRPMSSVAKATIDSAGPIIQYLVLLHRRTLQEQEEEHEGRAQSPPSKPRPKIKLRTKQKERARAPRQDTNKDAKRTAPPATNQLPKRVIKPNKSRADVMADRQRQRIQVLEQQLVDQKLLLLAHRKPGLGTSRVRDDDGSAIAPADLETVSDNESSERWAVRADDDDDGREQAVTVSVKFLHLLATDESDGIGDQQQTASWRTMKVPARLEFRLQRDESVLHLKQQIEARARVPVDHQILVAHSAGRAAPAVRLRNSRLLREYSEHAAGAGRWSLTLLIGQCLPLFSGHSAT
ncbi:leucine rich repeat [Phytophthora pseudosyringae]|uniref:Leucine rich repeat n=1 Tax=Phytophthora pseudosyringae TaxID=221518 RepID=A0A8T1WKD1_9STRA|nr:leucine rich repeat [Phytophthora pseudosyringae]